MVSSESACSIMQASESARSKSTPSSLDEERADKPMAVPYGRADLTALIGKDDFAVVGLVDKPLRFEGSNRLVHRCFGNVEALGNVNGPHAVFGSLFLLDANQAFQISSFAIVRCSSRERSVVSISCSHLVVLLAILPQPVAYGHPPLLPKLLE